jgi:hypothetical protein
VAYIWSDEIGEWRAESKEVFAFNGLGKQVLNARYIYSLQKEKLIDSKGKLIQEIRYDWQTDLTHWEKVSKNVLLSDENGDPSFQDRYAWNAGLSDWEIILRSIYYYRLSVSGIPEVFPDNISVWPNHTSGFINITGLLNPAEVKVYSIQGQLLKTVQKVESTLDVSDLPEGVFILNLAIRNKSVIRKIVIDR